MLQVGSEDMYRLGFAAVIVLGGRETAYYNAKWAPRSLTRACLPTCLPSNEWNVANNLARSRDLGLLLSVILPKVR